LLASLLAHIRSLRIPEALLTFLVDSGPGKFQFVTVCGPMRQLFIPHDENHPSYLYCVLFLVGLLLVLGCTEQEQEIGLKHGETTEVVQDTLPLATLVGSPAEYVGKEVTVTGTVASSLAFEFVTQQPYLLEDAGHSIWVITDGIIPPQGEQVTVSGVLVSPYQIKGRHYDYALMVNGGEQ